MVMLRSLPQVKAYHPRIGVRGKDGCVMVIRANLPDFALVDEILSDMGKNFNARTAGEVVEAIQNKRFVQSCVIDCSIENTAQSVDEDLPVVDWDHAVGES